VTETERDTAPQVVVTLTLADNWRSDPLRAIAGIREGLGNLDEWQRKAVEAAREQGRSWDEIGAACGVSRQAAWERFSKD
jgi:DNA-directed RNA polymerase specialized sigma24 family protein